MNSGLRNKIFNVMAESNGPKALDVFNMVVYFANGDIPVGIFSKVIQNRYELKEAIRTLQRHWLVQYSGESSFTVPEMIQTQQRCELFEIRVEEMILKKSISLLKTTRLSYYPHLVSVYGFSKRYPNLIRKLHDIPGNIVSGMIKDGKIAEAVEFGMECRAFLRAHLGECEWPVLHLRCNLGLALFESGKTEEAITIITNAYKQTCRTFENNKDRIRQVMEALATVTIGGKPILKQQNEKLLRRTVCNYERPSDCTSNMDLKRWLHYALMISSFGLKAEAIAILHDVIESRRKVFGWKDDVIGDVIQTEAAIMASDSKYPEAMALLQNVLNERKEKFGDFNPLTLEVMIEIGKLLIKQGNSEESLKLFEEIEDKLVKIVDTHDRMVLTVRTELVKIYSLKRDFVRSYDISLGVYDTLVSALGKAHPWCFSFRMDMGDILLELNRKDDAIKIFEELLETYENSPEHEQDLIELRSRVQSIKDARFDAEVGSLHYLAKAGNLNGVLAKINSGSDIEERDLTGMTPLHYASAFGQMQVARALLRKGACSTSRNNCQTLPYDVAEDAAMCELLDNARSVFSGVRSGDIDKVISDTSKEPCVASARDDGGRTPLGIAVEKNFTDIAIVLLETGADPTAPHSTTTSGTSLHLAASVAPAEMARILLRKVGPRRTATALAARDHEGHTPLHLAANRGHLEMVRTLLAKGAMFDAATRDGVTPLHLAKDTPCEPLLRLIQNLFVETRIGCVAAVSRRLEGLEEEDVPPVLGARNDKQWNLMHLAIRRNRLELVKKFVNLQKKHQENNRG